MSPELPSWVTQFRKGLVELCVLATLGEGEAYGYQIVERLGKAEGLATTESTVYPLLIRLEKDGVLAVRTAPSPSGPPRRYYRLTETGRRRFREMVHYWRQIEGSVGRLLEGGPS